MDIYKEIAETGNDHRKSSVLPAQYQESTSAPACSGRIGLFSTNWVKWNQVCILLLGGHSMTVWTGDLVLLFSWMKGFSAEM